MALRSGRVGVPRVRSELASCFFRFWSCLDRYIYISRRRRRVDLGAGSGRLLVVYT